MGLVGSIRKETGKGLIKREDKRKQFSLCFFIGFEVVLQGVVVLAVVASERQHPVMSLVGQTVTDVHWNMFSVAMNIAHKKRATKSCFQLDCTEKGHDQNEEDCNNKHHYKSRLAQVCELKRLAIIIVTLPPMFKTFTIDHMQEYLVVVIFGRERSLINIHFDTIKLHL